MLLEDRENLVLEKEKSAAGRERIQSRRGHMIAGDIGVPFTAEQRVWLQETFAADIVRESRGSFSSPTSTPDGNPTQDHGPALPPRHTPEQPAGTSGSGEQLD